MSWSRGSEFAERMIVIMEALHDGFYANGLEEAFFEMIEAFEDFDCDTLHECLGMSEEFDAAYNERYVDWEEG
jgi:hypothetical protein